MSHTNDLIEEHLDSFYEWVGDKKYEEAMDWCAEYRWHADDDHEEIIETYIEENGEELIKEYLNQLPECTSA